MRIERRLAGAFVKGNITRAFTIRDARVSEVAAHVEHALFGESPKHKATRAVESRGVAGAGSRYVGPADTQDEKSA